MSYIDFHAHVLPCADHGSNSVEMSLRQLSRAKKAGVTRIVATPHFYPDRHHVTAFLNMRSRAFDVLDARSNVSLPKVLLGAEVLLCMGLEHLEGIQQLCIEGTDVMLLEMPFSGVNEYLLETMYEMQSKLGLHVVLAHIDRYEEKTVREALATGARAQINAAGICSFSKRKRCLHWIAEDVVDALGSDIHRDGRQYWEFKKAIKLLGTDAEILFRRMENMLREQSVPMLR